MIIIWSIRIRWIQETEFRVMFFVFSDTVFELWTCSGYVCGCFVDDVCLILLVRSMFYFVQKVKCIDIITHFLFLPEGR